jgi:hypothetical protein
VFLTLAVVVEMSAHVVPSADRSRRTLVMSWSALS